MPCVFGLHGLKPMISMVEAASLFPDFPVEFYRDQEEPLSDPSPPLSMLWINSIKIALRIITVKKCNIRYVLSLN